MSGKSITLEVNAAHESLMRQFAAFLEEDSHLAAMVFEGSVLAASGH